jgi:predicted MFS family arabinose efflux permease
LLLVLGAGLILGGASAHTPLLGVPMAAVGFVVAARAFVRLVPTGTLRLAEGVPAAIATRGLLTFAFFGVDAYVSYTLVELHDTSTTLAGVALTAATLTWTAGSWVQERRVRAVGPRTFVRAGFVFVAIAIAGMVAVVEVSVPIAVAVLAWGVAGLGMGLAYSPQSLTVLSFAPRGREGDATASLQICDVLGVALGTGAAGAVVAAGDTAGWAKDTPLLFAFASLGVVAVLGAIAAGRMPARLAEPKA